MEAWPPEIQDQIQGFELPDGPIDIVIDCACALLDIPINNRVHALHQLLTLYQERFQVNISSVLVTEHKIEPNKGCKRDIMIF